MEAYTDQDLLNELLQLDPIVQERHGGVTVREYAESRGCSTRRACTVLSDLVRAGKLRRERTRVDGIMMFVYYRV